MRRQLLLLAIGCSLLQARVAPAQEPGEIINKAIEAHGGMERLARLRADWIKMEGKLTLADKEVPFEGETTVELPDKFKNVVVVNGPERRFQIVQILNGDKALVTIDGQPQKLSPAAGAEMREILQLDRAVRLVPLLRDPGFELDYVGESKVNDKPVLGVRVRARGRKELRLYFDKESYLLVKTEHTLEDGNGKEIRQEGYYSDFKDLGGYKKPHRMVAYRNGMKVMEAKLLEVKFLDKVDPSEFKVP
jgi:hypothetical protein